MRSRHLQHQPHLACPLPGLPDVYAEGAVIYTIREIDPTRPIATRDRAANVLAWLGALMFAGFLTGVLK